MAGKQRVADYEVGLSYKVDASELERARGLFNSLIEQYRNKSFDLAIHSDTKEVDEARIKTYELAKEFTSIFDRSYNVKLGTFDITRFQSELAVSKKAMHEFVNVCKEGGVQGELAISSLVRSIGKVETPIQQSTSLFKKFGEQILKSATWQASNSIIRQFSSVINEAYGYAKNLDRSLNSIRIVSGESAEEMAKFAKQANEAAKAMGTGTTDYTDAALIYYQQGLDDKSVSERTETTIKMSNVMRESAETVSSYMTAIWNNFYDGTKSIEYYGDALAKLGATTAASSQQIAQGMQKFASVADTVGLSYEYAAASLATVVAETQQSEDTVGTSFRTIFARLDSLKQGNEEEGVTLGKYSVALQKVGVNILDNNQNLKDMDVILDELGEKWGQIGKAEQVALAETVAGARQYATLIALMENWDKVKANVNVASGSEGTLEKQQETYLESTKAHVESLRATWEDLYDSVLDPKTINSALDAFKTLISLATKLVDALGGGGAFLSQMAGVALQLGSNLAGKELAKVFAPAISTQAFKEEVAIRKEILEDLEKELALKEESDRISNEQNEKEVDNLEEINNSLEKKNEKIEEYNRRIEETERELQKLNEEINNNPIEGRDLEGEKSTAYKQKDYLRGLLADTREEFVLSNNGHTPNEILKHRSNYSQEEIQNAKAYQKIEKAIGDLLGEEEAKIREIDALLKNREQIIKTNDAREKRLEELTQQEEIDRKNLKYEEEKTVQLKEQLEAAKAKKELEDAFNNSVVKESFENSVPKDIRDGTDYTKEAKDIRTAQKDVMEKAIKGEISPAEYEEEFERLNKQSILTDKVIISNEKYKKSLDDLSASLLKLDPSKMEELLKLDSEHGSMQLRTDIEGLNEQITTLNGLQFSSKELPEDLNLKVEEIGAYIDNVSKLEMEIPGLSEKMEEFNSKTNGGNLTGEIFAEQEEEILELIESIQKLIEKERERKEETKKAEEEAYEAYERVTKAINEQKAALLDKKQSEVEQQQKELEKRFTALTGAIGTTSQALGVLKNAQGIFEGISNGTLSVGDAMTRLLGILTSVIMVLAKLKKSGGETALALGGLELSFGQIFLIIAGLTVAIKGLTWAFEYFKKNFTFEGSYKEFEEQKEKVEGLSDEYENAKKKLEELQKAQKEGESVTDSELIKQKQITQELEKQLKDEKEKAKEAAKRALENVNYKNPESNVSHIEYQGQDVAFENRLSDKDKKRIYENNAETAGKVLDAYGRENIGASKEELSKIADELGVTAEKAKQDIDNAVQRYREYRESEGTLYTEYARFITESFTNSEENLNQISQILNNINNYLDVDGTANINKIKDALGEKVFKEIETSAKAGGESVQEMFNRLLTSSEGIEVLNARLNSLKNEVRGVTGSLDEQKHDIDDLTKILKDDFKVSEEDAIEVAEQFIDTLKKQNKELEIGEDAWKDFAYNVLKAQKAYDDLLAALDDYDELFGKGIDWASAVSKDSVNAAKAKAEIKKQLEKLFSVDDISSTWLEDNWNNIGTAIEDKDVATLEKYGQALKVAAGETALLKAAEEELETVIDGKELKIKLNTEEFQDSLAELTFNGIFTMDQLNNILSYGKASGIDLTEFLTSLANMYLATGKTIEEIDSLYSNMGYDIKFQEIPLYEMTTEQSSALRKGFDLTGKQFNQQNYAAYMRQRVTKTGAFQVVESITPKKGGGVTSLTNVLGNINKNGSSSTKSGSGSKGKSGSAKDPNVEKAQEDTRDLYHDINIELSKINRELEREKELQEHLYGANAIAAIEKELELYEKQKLTLEEKLKIQKNDLETKRKALEAQGVKFNEDGSIANYFDITGAKLNSLNSDIAKYNSMNADAQEKFKETLDTNQESFDDFLKDIEEYDKLFSETIPDTVDEITSTIRAQVAAGLKEFETKVQVNLDLYNAQRDWAAFENEFIKEFKGARLAAENAVDSYLPTEAELTDSVTVLGEAMGEITKLQAGETSAMFNTVDEAYKFLGESVGKAEEAFKKLKQQVEAVGQAWKDSLGEIENRYEWEIEKLNFINDLTEHQIQLTKLLYGEEAYSKMASYYAEQNANNEIILQNLKSQVDTYWDRVETSKEIFGEESEQYKEAVKLWMQSIGDLNAQVEKSIQNIKDEYENGINDIFNTWTRNLTGGISGENAKDLWELEKENSQQYLDTINRLYGIQGIKDKFAQGINANAGNLRAQQKIADAMNEQLGILEAKDKLTQYDLDRAEKIYDITMKQIALEESRNNKTTMKLKRDKQGNQSFVYTADESSILQAQQELLEAQQALYNLDLDAYYDNMDKYYQHYSEMCEKLAKVYRDYVDENGHLTEEGEKLKEQYVKLYGDLINGDIENNANIRKNIETDAYNLIKDTSKGSLLTDGDSVEETWKKATAEIEGLFDNSIQTMINTMTEQGGFGPTSKEVLSQLEDAAKKYGENTEKVFEAVGMSVEEYKEYLEDAKKKTEEMLIPIEEIENENRELTDAVDDAARSIKNQATAWDSLVTSITNVNSAYLSYLDTQKQVIEATKKATSAIKDMGQTAIDAQKQVNSVQTKSPSSSSGGSTGKTTTSSPQPAQSQPTVTYKVYIGKTPFTSNKSKNDAINLALNSIKHNLKPGDYTDDQIKSAFIKDEPTPYNIIIGKDWKPYMSTDPRAPGAMSRNYTYNTGGYTGEWVNGDKDGRLAMLHQKELVLNSADTANILSSVNIVRDIVAMMESFKGNLNTGLNGIINNLSGFNTSSNLQQTVTINADFPSVTDRNEIEEALNSLVNAASQYIG